MSRRCRRLGWPRRPAPGPLLVGALLAGSLVAGSVLAAGAAGAAADPATHADRPTAAQEMRLEISLSARELYEYRGDELVRTYPVAVGQPGHETPEGSWGIHQIDWNPDWTPPDSEWAADADYTPPGHPRNPMGRVRMIYRAPYSIHGTEELESLGRAASHGSVRMANDDIIELARRVMEAGGASRPDPWFDAVLAEPTEMLEVPLPNPVPLTNRP